MSALAFLLIAAALYIQGRSDGGLGVGDLVPREQYLQERRECPSQV